MLLRRVSRVALAGSRGVATRTSGGLRVLFFGTDDFAVHVRARVGMAAAEPPL